jgi:hypothetical protein
MRRAIKIAVGDAIAMTRTDGRTIRYRADATSVVGSTSRRDKMKSHCQGDECAKQKSDPGNKSAASEPDGDGDGGETVEEVGSEDENPEDCTDSN